METRSRLVRYLTESRLVRQKFLSIYDARRDEMGLRKIIKNFLQFINDFLENFIDIQILISVCVHCML
jgi:hypothetical protein